MTLDNEPWHLNKSVPVTLIFAIIIQAAAIVAAGTTMRGDILENKKDIEYNAKEIVLGEQRLDIKSEKFNNSIQSQALLLARIDETLKGIHAQLEILNN